MAKSIKLNVVKVTGAYNAFLNAYGVTSLNENPQVNYEICVLNNIIYLCLNKEWKKFITINPEKEKFVLSNAANFSDIIVHTKNLYCRKNTDVEGTIFISEENIQILLNGVWTTVINYSIGDIALTEKENETPEISEEEKVTPLTKSEAREFINEVIDSSNITKASSSTVNMLNSKIVQIIRNIVELLPVEG